MAVALVTAAVLVAGLPQRHADYAARLGSAPLRQRGAIRVYGLTVGVGLVIGMLEAGVPLQLEGAGMDPAAAGPFLAATALGSGIAGLIASAQIDGLAGVRWKAAALLGLLALVLVGVGRLQPGPAYVGALIALGLPLAPLNAMGSLVLQRVVPRARQAEGFAVYVAALLAGAGSGQLLVGWAGTRLSPTALFTVAGVIALLLGVAVLGAALRRRALGLPQRIAADPAQDPPVPASAS